MSDSPEIDGLRRPWWAHPKALNALANVLYILIVLVMIPLTPVLSVQVARTRARLRRAMRRQWGDEVRYLVWDGDGVWDEGGVWAAALRDEWLPRHGSTTIVVPEAERPDASPEERLARRALYEWGEFNKRPGRVVAVVVGPGAEPARVQVWAGKIPGPITDRESLLQGLTTMAELGRNAVCRA